jgi:redox-sensitive bicupin YhaK (pirin superfamily)
MSNLDATPSLTHGGGRTGVATRPVHEVYPGRDVLVGESTRVRRLLPTLGRRLVGAWCFTDHYGPDDIADASGMSVPPHPHLGLQTVSWLLAGTVHHRDSLGNDQLIQPGELGLMTSGHAIAHAEHSPQPHPAELHGVQLWVALPEAARHQAPAWAHHTVLPVLTDHGSSATLILGALGGATSPGTVHSPLVGADIDLAPGGELLVPLEPDFEHAVLVMAGQAVVDGVAVPPGAMVYLGCGRRDLRATSESGARLLLLGGEPFEEPIVMWWNFVARSSEEIAEAREQWAAGERFGRVADAGTPMTAPPLPPGRLKARGRER